MVLFLQAAQEAAPVVVETGPGFWETTWATFVGGAAAALISLGGVWLFERGRARQAERAAQRERRRLARNAAQSVLMELARGARPMETMVNRSSGWEPMVVKRTAWDDQVNRGALNDTMEPRALAEVDHAYHELAGIEEKLRYAHHSVYDNEWWARWSADDWKLGEKILDIHIRPGIRRLHELIADLEVQDLADGGRLKAEAARVRAKDAAAQDQRDTGA